MKKTVAVLLAGSLLLTVLPETAAAQSNTDEVSNNGVKGAIGLGLLAGELVVNIEAGAGVKKGWIFAVTGLVAAGGGAAGGYFAETKPSKATGAKVGVGLPAGGMAMLVPTMIICTALTRYGGKEEAAAEVEVVTESSTEEEEAFGGEAGTEEAGAPAPEAAPAEESTEEPPAAMINVSGKRLSLAVPPLMMLPVFSEDEIGVLTDEQKTEYRLNIINVIF